MSGKFIDSPLIKFADFDDESTAVFRAPEVTDLSIEDVIRFARVTYDKTREALDHADQDDNELCLILSDGACKLPSMIAVLDRIRRTRQ